MHFVYILKNKIDGTLYKGFTKDLDVRLLDHAKGTTKTTRRKGKEYELIWFAAFEDRYKALAFEKYLKSGSGRAFISKRLV